MCSWRFILFSYQGGNMKRLYLYLVALVFSCFCGLSYAAGQLDPAGVWQTPRSVLRIHNANGVLSAEVLQIRKHTASSSPVCTKCSGSLKDKPIIGMTVMWGLKQKDADQWDGGKVVDPETGETYNASLKLSPDGKTISFYASKLVFGKMVTWKRIR